MLIETDQASLAEKARVKMMLDHSKLPAPRRVKRARPKLSTPRLQLREWLTSDRGTLVQYANNRKVARQLQDYFMPYPYTAWKAAQWIQTAIETNRETGGTEFAIVVDGKAVGGASLILGRDVYRCCAEFVTWLGEPYWGRGLASETARLLTDHAFRTWKLSRVYSGVFGWNPGGARMLEKAGYTFESRIPRSIIKSGKIIDQLIYVRFR